jgi:hypothetical protein
MVASSSQILVEMSLDLYLSLRIRVTRRRSCRAPLYPAVDCTVWNRWSRRRWRSRSAPAFRRSLRARPVGQSGECRLDPIRTARSVHREHEN